MSFNISTRLKELFTSKEGRAEVERILTDTSNKRPLTEVENHVLGAAKNWNQYVDQLKQSAKSSLRVLKSVEAKVYKDNVVMFRKKK